MQQTLSRSLSRQEPQPKVQVSHAVVLARSIHRTICILLRHVQRCCLISRTSDASHHRQQSRPSARQLEGTLSTHRLKRSMEANTHAGTTHGIGPVGNLAPFRRCGRGILLMLDNNTGGGSRWYPRRPSLCKSACTLQKVARRSS